MYVRVCRWGCGSGSSLTLTTTFTASCVMWLEALPKGPTPRVLIVACQATPLRNVFPLSIFVFPMSWCLRIMTWPNASMPRTSNSLGLTVHPRVCPWSINLFHFWMWISLATHRIREPTLLGPGSHGSPIPGGSHIHFTTKFKYLGSKITSKLSDNLYVKPRIAIENSQMGEMKELFRCKDISRRTKKFL
jgi:hypothetical protein